MIRITLNNQPVDAIIDSRLPVNLASISAFAGVNCFQDRDKVNRVIKHYFPIPYKRYTVEASLKSDFPYFIQNTRFQASFIINEGWKSQTRTVMFGLPFCSSHLIHIDPENLRLTIRTTEGVEILVPYYHHQHQIIGSEDDCIHPDSEYPESSIRVPRT